MEYCYNDPFIEKSEMTDEEYGYGKRSSRFLKPLEARGQYKGRPMIMKQIAKASQNRKSDTSRLVRTF